MLYIFPIKVDTATKNKRSCHDATSVARTRTPSQWGYTPPTLSGVTQRAQQSRRSSPSSFHCALVADGLVGAISPLPHSRRMRIYARWRGWQGKARGGRVVILISGAGKYCNLKILTRVIASLITLDNNLQLINFLSKKFTQISSKSTYMRQLNELNTYVLDIFYDARDYWEYILLHIFYINI